MSYAACDFYAPLLPIGNSWCSSGGVSGTAPLMDELGDRIAVMFRCPIAGDIDSISFVTGSVTTGNGTSTGAENIRVTLEGVDLTTGLPDGTPLQTEDYVDISSNSLHTAPASGAWGETVTKGQSLALVFKVNQAGMTGSCGIYMISTSTNGFRQGWAYTATFEDNGAGGGSWTKQPTFQPMLLITYNGVGNVVVPGVHVPMVYQFMKFQALGTSTMYGNRLTLPFAYKTDGAWYVSDTDDDVTVEFFETTAAGSAAESHSFDKDVRPGTVNGVYFVSFDSEYQVAKDTSVIVAAKGASSITNGCTYFEVADTNYLSLLDNYGNLIQYASGTAGSWTMTNTKRVQCGLHISKIISTDIAGAMLNYQGMAGGMNG